MLGFIGALIKPLSRIIEKAVPDKDLQEQLKAEITAQLLDQNSELMQAQASIIRAEAQGKGWLQNNWRPITMISFLALLFAYWFGYAPDYVRENPALVEKLFDLLQIGIGGYIAGRSVEKVARTISDAGGVKKMMG